MPENEYPCHAVLNDVATERHAQDSKWGPHQRHSMGCWLGILMEEVGESAKAFIENTSDDVKLRELRKELIQTAAVAVAWIEQLDAVGLYPFRHQAEGN